MVRIKIEKKGEAPPISSIDFVILLYSKITFKTISIFLTIIIYFWFFYCTSRIGSEDEENRLSKDSDVRVNVLQFEKALLVSEQLLTENEEGVVVGRRVEVELE